MSEAAVERVVAAFRSEGERAGFQLARRLGPLYVQGARIYVDHRATSEEELALKVAELNAAHARSGSAQARVRMAFLDARLSEVRGAARRAETPPQAVRDRPEVPVKPAVPRWLSYVAVGLSFAGVYLGWSAHAKAPAGGRA